MMQKGRKMRKRLEEKKEGENRLRDEETKGAIKSGR